MGNPYLTGNEFRRGISSWNNVPFVAKRAPSSKGKWTSHSTFRVKAPIFQSLPAASRRGVFLRQLIWVDLRIQNARSRNCNFDQKAPESQALPPRCSRSQAEKRPPLRETHAGRNLPPKKRARQEDVDFGYSLLILAVPWLRLAPRLRNPSPFSARLPVRSNTMLLATAT